MGGRKGQEREREVIGDEEVGEILREAGRVGRRQ